MKPSTARLKPYSPSIILMAAAILDVIHPVLYASSEKERTNALVRLARKSGTPKKTVIGRRLLSSAMDIQTTSGCKTDDIALMIRAAVAIEQLVAETAATKPGRLRTEKLRILTRIAYQDALMGATVADDARSLGVARQNLHKMIERIKRRHLGPRSLG